jgi:hypothetical protein
MPQYTFLPLVLAYEVTPVPPAPPLISGEYQIGAAGRYVVTYQGAFGWQRYVLTPVPPAQTLPSGVFEVTSIPSIKGSVSMQIWLEIMAILSSLGGNATVQKILTCLLTSSGWTAILACITGTLGGLTPGTADHAACSAICDKLKAHIAAGNP